MHPVEVWSVALDEAPDGLAALLSAPERARAQRLAAPDRWVAARAALRLVLAERLGTAPARVAFEEGPHGKPAVAGLRFNLSHSGATALIAVADEAEVGVDVERTNRRSHAIERTLTAGERAGLDGGDRHLQLLRIWCRKEALAKALGRGLGWAPERFDTSRPEGHVLHDLELPAGYVGALAVAAERIEVIRRRFEY